LSTTQVPYPNYVGLANASALPESTLYVADRDVILIRLAMSFIRWVPRQCAARVADISVTKHLFPDRYPKQARRAS
jgi:hypothetical protein